MSARRLLITRPLPQPVFEAAKNICDVTMSPENTPLDLAAARQSLADFDAILPTLGDIFTAPAFAPEVDVKCQILANFGVGYNHIDTKAARQRGVSVTNTPGAVTDATADIAITLMLMVARRAGEGERLVRSGNWQGWNPTQMLGTHIGGKTLGIIGMGRIGKAVARRAHFGFGMNIVFFNRSCVGESGVPEARQLETIAEIMAQSDLISINVPGSPENRHLISAEILAMAKPGSFLINTARGDVIDQDALIYALKNGELAGAGLDVYEHEPNVPKALCEIENVVLLPHLGTNALEVRIEMGLMAVANIEAFFAGRIPPNQV